MADPSARRFFDSTDPARWGREEMPEQGRVTLEWLQRVAPPVPTLELGCGKCALAAIAPEYVGLDLAFAPLAAAPRGIRRLSGDMESLPFRDQSIGFVFSWAAIEHVPNPERVLAEIERVLKPGGVALLAPAWHCRPWAAEGLEFLPYAKLRPMQRLRKRLIPFRNAIWWRALFELPNRVRREAMAALRVPSFEYSRLQPNLEEYVGTDCDAFTSMDPQSAILYFAARGWEALSHPGLRRRMLARHEPVVVRKPRR
jgi:SAM-dependent methyltransferase